MLRSNVNNADPDQRPLQSAIFEPGLHIYILELSYFYHTV